MKKTQKPTHAVQYNSHFCEYAYGCNHLGVITMAILKDTIVPEVKVRLVTEVEKNNPSLKQI